MISPVAPILDTLLLFLGFGLTGLAFLLVVDRLSEWCPETASICCGLLRIAAAVAALAFVVAVLGSAPSHGSTAASVAIMALKVLWFTVIAARFRDFGAFEERERTRILTLAQLQDTERLSVVRHIGEQLGLPNSPTVRLDPNVTSPAATDLVSGTIILPEWFLATATDTQFRLAIIHEVLHLKRRDPLWLRAPSLLGILLPYLWVGRWSKFLNQIWTAAHECACDQAVLQTSGTRWAAYAALLEKLSTPAGEHTLLATAAFGSLVERRVRAIMHSSDPLWRRQRRQRAAVASAVGLLIAALPVSVRVRRYMIRPAVVSVMVPHWQRPHPRALMASDDYQSPATVEREADQPRAYIAVPIQLWKSQVPVHQGPSQDAPIVDYVAETTPDMRVWGTTESDGTLKLYRFRSGWLSLTYSRAVDGRQVHKAGWVWGGDVLEPLHTAYRLARGSRGSNQQTATVVQVRTVDASHCEVVRPDGTHSIEKRNELIMCSGVIPPIPPEARGI